MEFKFAIPTMNNTKRQNRLEVQTVQIEPKTILTNQSTNGGWEKNPFFKHMG